MNTEAKLPPDDSGAEASEAWHAAKEPADVIEPGWTASTPDEVRDLFARIKPRRLTWAEWKVAIDSGWRAGLKQYRTMRTKMRNAK